MSRMMRRFAAAGIMAVAAGSLGVASVPASACTGSAGDPVHCINNNQAIDGFLLFYLLNLYSPFNPFGPMQGAGPAAPAVEQGGETAARPSITSFAEPGAVPSLASPSRPNEPFDAFMAREGGILELQERSLANTRARLADLQGIIGQREAEIAKNQGIVEAYDAQRDRTYGAISGRIQEVRRKIADAAVRRSMAEGAGNASEAEAAHAEVKALQQEMKDLQAEERQHLANRAPPSNEVSWEDASEARRRVSGLRGDLAFARTAAAEMEGMIATQETMIADTRTRIEVARTTGELPAQPGQVLTQFPAGTGEEGFRHRAGDRSTFARLRAKGEPFTLAVMRFGGGRVDMWFRGDVGSQFLRSVSGHAESGPGRELTHGASRGFEDWAAFLNFEPFVITHQVMLQGLHRNLRDAVRDGRIPGTIELTATGDHNVIIPPEGFEAAKPFFDAIDSLFESLQEEFRNTESDQNRMLDEEERQQRESWDRIFSGLSGPDPVDASDVQHHSEPQSLESILDEIEEKLVIS